MGMPMTIKNRLRGTGIVLISFTLVIIACFLVSMHEMKGAVDKRKISDEISRGAAQLTILARAYAADPEELFKRQWLERYDSLARLLSQTSYDSSERDVIERLKETQASTKRIFEKLVASYEGEGTTPAPLRQLRLESKERLVTQLIAKNQEMEYNGYLLDRKNTEEIDAIQTKAFFLILGLIILLLVVLFFASSRLYKAIVYPLHSLEAATGQIAAGRLDFQAPETEDEVGRLARAFNRMGHSLGDSYANLSMEVAERRKAEEGLKELNETLEQRVAKRTAQLGESEQRYATTLASIGDAVIATDVGGRITFMNAVAEELTGWALDEASRKPVMEVFNIINEHSRSAVENPVAKVLREGMVVGLANHTILVKKDGIEIPIDDSGAPIRDREGKTTGVVLVFRDITKRKQSEEELRRAQEELRGERDRIREYMNIAGVLLVVLDREGRVTLMNRKGNRLLGYEEGELLGKDWFTTCLPERTRDELAHVFKKLINGDLEKVESYENPVLTKQGEEKIIAWHNTVLRDEADNITGSLSSGEDITERRRAEEALRKAHNELEMRVKERTTELQQAYDRLKEETEERERVEAQLRQAQKMEALGTLSGGIAHDFNNILAAIIGFTELLADHVPKESREAHHLKRVMESSLRGRDLVRQMLAFSRKAEQEKKPLNLSSIVKETVNLIRATTPTTISIKVNTVSESYLILGDPTQIQQVLINLCTNAAYAMREKGGSLDIGLNDFSVSALDGNPDGIRPGLYVKLTVRDTGTGMSPDIMDKIFDPFFTTKKVGEGTGLGLSVVHGIVKHSNGYITAESELGRGSTFTVYFPKITGELETDEVSDDELPTGSERILFIDDEEALVEMGEDILAELGYEVTSRMSSTEALALFRLDPSGFDLVITDQTMPELTGVELAKEILTLRPDMPIIMVTGFSYVVDADKARTAGIKAFAMKPLMKREIARTIRKALGE